MSLTKVSFSMIEGMIANILDFGADPTGVNDSAPAIQAAIDHLDSLGEGGVVYFPEGQYKTLSTIELKTMVNLQGVYSSNELPGFPNLTSGGGSAILPRFNGDCLRFTNANAPNPTVLGCNISDLMILGVNDGTYTSGNGIVLENVADCTLTQVNIFYMPEDNFVIGTENNSAAANGPYHNWLFKCYSNNAGGDAITTTGKCYFIRSRFTRMIDCLCDGGEYGVYITGFGGWTEIERGHYEGQTYAQIRILNSGGFHNISNTRFIPGYFSTPYGVLMDSSLTRIQNCDFRGNTGGAGVGLDAISMGGNPASPAYNIISGNFISGYSAKGIKTSRSNCVITDNIIFGVQDPVVIEADSTTFCDNIITDTGGTYSVGVDPGVSIGTWNNNKTDKAFNLTGVGIFDNITFYNNSFYAFNQAGNRDVRVYNDAYGIGGRTLLGTISGTTVYAKTGGGTPGVGLGSDDGAGAFVPYLVSTATFTVPGSNNAMTLGNASLRWSEVFATNGTINTSDEREKQQVRDLTDVEKAVAQKIKGLICAFKWNHAVEEKGDDARIHIGVMAQEVKAAFESEGLDAHKYGMFCYDEWKEVVDDDGNVVVQAGNSYGVRYEQLLAFVIAAM
jgi:hypothetical protein